MKKYLQAIISLILLHSLISAQELSLLEKIKDQEFMEEGLWVEGEVNTNFIVLPARIKGTNNYDQKQLLKFKKNGIKDILKRINQEKDLSELFPDNIQAIKKWNNIYEPFQLFNEINDQEFWKNPKFFSNLTKLMIQTRSFLKTRTNLVKSLEKPLKSKIFNDIDDNFFTNDILKILKYSWSLQTNLNVTEGLVQAEITWLLNHADSFYYDARPEKDWWIWGGLGDSFIRGLICNPEEVVLAISNKKSLDALPLEVVLHLKTIATQAVQKDIGERVGSYDKGKIVRNSPEIEKRRKVAKEKYLPQINKIIADYLKDKKADK